MTDKEKIIALALLLVSGLCLFGCLYVEANHIAELAHLPKPNWF